MMLFDLKQRVRLVESGETGEVIGRAQYVESADVYLVRYVAADGGLVEAWWSESTLEGVK